MSIFVIVCFDTVEHQEEHPACKKLSDLVLAWLSVCTAVPPSLASFKSRLV